jgi:2-phospho-L-lactate guanylyltransferase
VASTPPPRPGWTLVLPLKGGPAAKSRLGAAPELAWAIAGDCLDAVLACPAVAATIVVTAHPQTAADALAAGASVVGESHPHGGLATAVRDGLATVTSTGPVGVLLGDLPALRPADLAAGLAAVATALRRSPAAPMAAVPDAAGTGTVLLAAHAAGGLDPAFGPGSLTEHIRRGALLVELDAPRLRQDVDTRADLLAALALGVGPRTAAVLASAPSVGWAPSRDRRPVPPQEPSLS